VRLRAPTISTKSPRVTGKGASTTIALRATKSGDFIYFCSVPGHQLAGMQGQFIVTPRPAPQAVVAARPRRLGARTDLAAARPVVVTRVDQRTRHRVAHQ
jgi:heme/copper-type cytochrome/quinol oxidase subunit 2